MKGKDDFDKSLNPKVVVSCGCTCNLKKMTTIQNNMGSTATHITCEICSQEWEIIITKAEEGDEEEDENHRT